VTCDTCFSLLKSALPPQDPNQTFHHIRRFAKPSFLPQHLRGTLSPNSSEPLDKARESSDAATVHLIILPSAPPVDQSVVTALLSDLTLGPLRTTLIPLLPPNSTAQADEFSRKYWPCVYNPSAPPSSHSPPPFLISQALEQISDRAGWYLSIAEELGAEARELRRGRGVGVVIVDTDVVAANGGDGIVAVAGDARYWHDGAPGRETGVIDGRPEHHAVMRAISLVAYQHRLSSSSDNPSSPPQALPHPPPMPPESSFLTPTGSLIATGKSTCTYLCTNLSIYISHEPCVCCSMGIIHSRFRSIVFRRRLNATGGMAAEVKPCDKSGNESRVGYGLFWRKELNWRCLGWEFKTGECDGVCEAMFHA